MAKQQIPSKFLTVEEVLALIRVSRATLHAWRRSGLFPPGVMIGARRVGFPEYVVQQWIAARPSSAVRPPAA